MDQQLQDRFFGLYFVDFIERVPRFADFSLSKRDVCADAIPGTITQTCTPGNTLCCVPSDTSVQFPQCQTILGKGFCCVKGNDCYIDTVSNCGVPGSVSCSLLTPETSQACCPPLTFCPGNFNQSVNLVRCNLAQSQAAVASSTTSKSSTTFSTTSTSSSTTSSRSSPSSEPSSTVTTTSFSSNSAATDAGVNVTPTPTNIASSTSSKGLTAGTAAGIGIGAAMGILILIGVGFLLYRRGKRRGAEKTANETAQLSTAPTQSYPSYHDTALGGVHKPPEYGLYGPGQGVNYSKYELPWDRHTGLVELMDTERR